MEYNYSQTLGLVLEYKHSCYYFAKVYVRACGHACMRANVRADLSGHSFFIMHGFQSYLTQFLFLRRSSVI